MEKGGTIVIDREKWARKTEGLDKGPSRLLNDQGNMCCLGFAMKQCGCSNKKLLGISKPDQVINSYRRKTIANNPLVAALTLAVGPGYRNSVLTGRLVAINDNQHTTDAEKELVITRLFKEDGFNVEFIN